MSPSPYRMAAFVSALMAVAWTPAGAQNLGASLRAQLSGYQEVIPAGGAVSTTATGEFRGKISPDGNFIDYELTYDFPTPLSAAVDTQYVNQAHFHFGQESTTGGIIVFLCFTETPPALP